MPEIWERIDWARKRWNVLRHPFYVRWSAGELTPQELARYSGQYRHAVRAIADLSEAVASALPERTDLRGHAREEREHVELWEGFVEAADGSPSDAPLPETAECVRAWIAQGSILRSLAVLYAIESAQPEISRIKREGLIEHYRFEDGPATEYFRVHASLDSEHAALSKELIEELAGPDDEDQLPAAAEVAFRGNWRLLDGV
jgi:pyrroloquinoline-quinone synthase